MAGMAKAKDPNRGTEYGGVAGLVQPAPHEPDAREKLMGIYDTDPADVTSQPTYGVD